MAAARILFCGQALAFASVCRRIIKVVLWRIWSLNAIL